VPGGVLVARMLTRLAQGPAQASAGLPGVVDPARGPQTELTRPALGLAQAMGRPPRVRDPVQAPQIALTRPARGLAQAMGRPPRVRQRVADLVQVHQEMLQALEPGRGLVVTRPTGLALWQGPMQQQLLPSLGDRASIQFTMYARCVLLSDCHSQIPSTGSFRCLVQGNLSVTARGSWNHIGVQINHSGGNCYPALEGFSWERVPLRLMRLRLIVAR
jgi:hypothetical protein